MAAVQRKPELAGSRRRRRSRPQHRLLAQNLQENLPLAAWSGTLLAI